MSGIRTQKILEQYEKEKERFDSFPSAMLKLVDWQDILDINTIYYDLIEFVYEKGNTDAYNRIIGFLKFHRYAIVDNNGDYYSVEELEKFLKGEKV